MPMWDDDISENLETIFELFLFSSSSYEEDMIVIGVIHVKMFSKAKEQGFDNIDLLCLSAWVSIRSINDFRGWFISRI